MCIRDSYEDICLRHIVDGCGIEFYSKESRVYGFSQGGGDPVEHYVFVNHKSDKNELPPVFFVAHLYETTLPSGIIKPEEILDHWLLKSDEVKSLMKKALSGIDSSGQPLKSFKLSDEAKVVLEETKGQFETLKLQSDSSPAQQQP